MKKFTLALLILITLCTCSWAQQQAAIKQAADVMAQAFIKGDYLTLAKYTHPKVVAMMGGKEKMVAIVKNGMTQMKNQGVTFKEATVGAPGKIISTGTALYAVVPQRFVIQANGQSISSSTSLLACSTDKGKSWTFTDAGKMTDEQVKKLFPGVLGKLVIPKQTMPAM